MDTYLNNLNCWNLGFRCHTVFTEQHVKDVLAIEQAVFPSHMQDSFEELSEFFADEFAHGLILRKGRQPVGVLKGQHLDESNTPNDVLTLPELEGIRDATFYMDSVGILKEVRSTQVLDFLMHEMAVDMHRFDYQFVTAHARRKGGLSRLYQRRYKAKVLTTYDDWCGFGEAFDYILVDLNDVPVQTPLRRFIYRLARGFLYRFY